MASREPSLPLNKAPKGNDSQRPPGLLGSPQWLVGGLGRGQDEATEMRTQGREERG